MAPAEPGIIHQVGMDRASPIAHGVPDGRRRRTVSEKWLRACAGVVLIGPCEAARHAVSIGDLVVHPDIALIRVQCGGGSIQGVMLQDIIDGRWVERGGKQGLRDGTDHANWNHVVQEGLASRGCGAGYAVASGPRSAGIIKLDVGSGIRWTRRRVADSIREAGCTERSEVTPFLGSCVSGDGTG